MSKMTVHKSALWALVVLVVASSMIMVIAAPVVAQSVDEVRVTPATASSSAGYTVTITTTANLDPGGSVTLTFPDEVVLPDAMDNEYVFIDGQQASVHPVVDGQDVIITVTHQVPPSTFRVLLSQGSGIKNPLIAKKHTDPTVTDPYKIKVATSAEGTIGELAYTIVPRFGLSTKTGDRDTPVYVSGAGWTPNTSVTIGGALSGSGDIQADGTFFIAATPIRSGMVTCIDGAGHGSRGSNGYWDIQASSFTLSAVTPVRTWYVDDDLVEYPAADFTAIQDAVDAAGTDDTVIVYPGTYNENVSVNKEVTIRSYSGAESTFVTAANPNDHVIEVTADGVAIEGFSIHGATGNDYAGIYLNGVDGCAIEDNRCGWNAEHGNRYGIHLYSASDNTIMRNIANENGIGIYMESSSDTILTDNTMINDGIFISGDALEHWNTHTIDSSNIVNGSPVYYLSDEDGGTVPAKAGQVVLANCSNIVIENQKVSGVTMGIALGFSSHNEVRHNSVNDSLVGIYLSNSHDNTLYQNSLSDNNLNIQSEASSNTWSSPEKMAYTYNGNHYVNYLGNYYSDYRGTDDGSGNRVAGDGVGDTDIPYAIDGDGDNYPLMLPAEHYTIVTSRVAEASIAAEIDEDGVVAIPVAITAIEDVITGETISGVSITAY